MKRVVAVATIFLALLSGATHAGPKTYIVIGDSIMAAVADGTSSDLALQLISNERNVTFRNLSSAGAAMGVTDHTGFNNKSTIDTLSKIGGYYSAYDGIIIQTGTNDFGRDVPWENMVTGMYRVLDHAKALGKKVLILDPIWRFNENTPNGLNYTLNTYRYISFLACAQYQGTCFYAHREHSVMGTSAGAAHYGADEVAGGFQVHPNKQGHRYLADWIKAEAATFGLF